MLSIKEKIGQGAFGSVYRCVRRRRGAGYGKSKVQQDCAVQDKYSARSSSVWSGFGVTGWLDALLREVESSKSDKKDQWIISATQQVAGGYENAPYEDECGASGLSYASAWRGAQSSKLL